MTTVKFDPTKGPLKVCFDFTGPFFADYTYKLREANSNALADGPKPGDNKNTQDDCYLLPTPVEQNDGRKIVLSTDFVSPPAQKGMAYSIVATVSQNGTSIGSDTDSGTLTGDFQDSLLVIFLQKI
ncbi:MAG TPA: hypothetical protein VG603_01565 [Chitinophagales bacterium]|nr:hypothetical protein [Chitinophagales bacterium]